MTFINPYEIICECPLCHKVNIVTVEFHHYLDYAFEYVKAQDAFSYLSAGERELIISGTCSECWNKLFADYEEEEEGEEDYEDFNDDVDETGFNPYEGCYDFDC